MKTEEIEKNILIFEFYKLIKNKNIKQLMYSVS